MKLSVAVFLLGAMCAAPVLGQGPGQGQAPPPPAPIPPHRTFRAWSRRGRRSSSSRMTFRVPKGRSRFRRHARVHRRRREPDHADRSRRQGLGVSREFERIERAGVRLEGSDGVGPEGTGACPDRRHRSQGRRSDARRRFQRQPERSRLAKNDGVYFTVPGPLSEAQARGKAPSPTPFVPAVYYIAPNSGRAVKVAEGITNPNGIQLSPDEKTLYVNDTRGEYLIAMDVQPNGILGPKRNFAKYEGVQKTRRRRERRRRSRRRH